MLMPVQTSAVAVYRYPLWNLKHLVKWCCCCCLYDESRKTEPSRLIERRRWWRARSLNRYRGLDSVEGFLLTSRAVRARSFSSSLSRRCSACSASVCFCCCSFNARLCQSASRKSTDIWTSALARHIPAIQGGGRLLQLRATPHPLFKGSISIT